MSTEASPGPTVGSPAKSPAKARKSPKKSPIKATSIDDKVAKKSTDKSKTSHPNYQTMITAAIKNLKEINGSSKKAILKYIMANYDVGGNIDYVNSRLRKTLKRGMQKQILKQSKGRQGTNGSYRLGEKSPSPKKLKKPVTKRASNEPPKKSSPKKVVKRAKKTLAVSPALTSDVTKSVASTNREALKKVRTPKNVKTPKKARTPKKAKAGRPMKAAKSPKAKPSKVSPAKKAAKSPKKNVNE